MAQAAHRTPPEDRGLTGQTENVKIDWPRSLGFFGALGAAVALDLVPVPIAAFVAAVPFLKLLNRPNATKPQRFFSHLVDGAAKPVGGDSEGTIRWAPREHRSMAKSRGRRNRTTSTGRRGKGGRR